MSATVLPSLRRRLGGWVATRTALWLLGAAGGAALGLVLLDAVLDLPEAWRITAPWLLAGVAAMVLGLGLWQWRRCEESRVARLFERVDPALGNRLINAVQLSRQSGSSEVEEYLRLEAVALGRQAAAGVATWPAVRRGVLAGGGIAGTVMLCWLCLFGVAGDVLEAVMPRFLDPRGDHPPYSRLRIEVSPGKTQVLYGGQVEVRAKVGPGNVPVDKLWLVAKSGTNTLRAIMFLAPDKSFFQTLANLREPTEYYATDGRARSHRFLVGIRYTPQINLVETTTAFPEYTGRTPRTFKLTDEPQALPADTRVSFRVASNRPLKSGRLTLTPVLGGKPSEVNLVPEGQSNIVTGTFTFHQPVVFAISVRDTGDLDSAEPRQGRFNLLPDERPRLFVLEPGRDAVATPSVRVPVRVEATDDYGISRVVWLRGFNRSLERPFTMKMTPKSGPQAVEATGALDFSKLGVHPGDVVEYYFEAADNDPRGPNLALSRLYRLEIVTQEQYEMILRQAAARKALFEPYFQLDAWLKRLAERARTLDKEGASNTDTKNNTAARAAEALAAELEKYEQELAQLLQQAMLFDVEQSFRNTLVAQHTRISRIRQQLARSAGSGMLDRDALAEAARALSEMSQQEQEEVEQPAQQIRVVAHLLAQANTFVRLARQQAMLAQLARRFAEKKELTRLEQMELQELAEQQRHIQDALRLLLDSLPALLAQVPDEPQYEPLRDDVKGFLTAVGEAGIEGDLAEAAQKLSGLNGEAGHQFAQQAADKMDRLVGKCKGMQQQGSMCLRFKPSVQAAMGNTLGQILAAMGANQGQGQGGADGYGMFNDDVALYGPSIQLAGEQAGGRRDSSAAAGRRAERVAGQNRDSGTRPSGAPGRVRLQTDAKFPLRYRDLVGEYFRVMGEWENQNGGTK